MSKNKPGNGSQSGQKQGLPPAKLPENKDDREKVIEAEIIKDPAVLNRPGVQQILMSMQVYQGPVPPAKQFADYEAAVPGSGMRLIDLSEKALTAQNERASSAQDADYAEARRGQWMAWSLAVFAMAGGVALGLNGAAWPGALFGSGGLAAIIYLFIQGKKRS
ncbi:hypothetical protein [Pseudoxanthomonas sp. X-1]|uniref:hypothetical protein n=1 Tax=Pseudoxanthomonas sp. X-1 TaxID=2571115 RepID=UPI00110A2FD8|nr:hypothetical protein [Pseudoxanthomonas sp. X-1]TMN18492.1 hypothetical protein FF950_14525 [Pseudoxanthomonas sp. X-1]UAY76004.1 hypothetical protein LAJ50_07140 [Pseudoxanthomonas sp. X-1]